MFLFVKGIEPVVPFQMSSNISLEEVLMPPYSHARLVIHCHSILDKAEYPQSRSAFAFCGQVRESLYREMA